MPRNKIYIADALAGMVITLAINAVATAAPVRSQALARATTAHAQPAKVIAHFDYLLIKSMKAGKDAGFDKRYAMLKPFIAHRFDFNYIAHLVVGAHWTQFKQNQKQTFIKTFKRYITTTYAARFNAYSGEKFKLGRSQNYRQLKVVHTQFRESNGKTHQFDYLMRQSDGHWKIVNVLADGVSNLSLKRSQYTQILQTKTIDSLINYIKRETAKLKNNITSTSQS